MQIAVVGFYKWFVKGYNCFSWIARVAVRYRGQLMLSEFQSEYQIRLVLIPGWLGLFKAALPGCGLKQKILENIEFARI